MTLVEFLLARISEDEADARDSGPCDCLIEGVPLEHGYSCPARVLAECASKRRIMERHVSTEVLDHHEFDCTCGFRFHRRSECRACGTCTYDEGEIPRPYGPCPDLRLLALPFADHPDYQQEWAV